MMVSTRFICLPLWFLLLVATFHVTQCSPMTVRSNQIRASHGQSSIEAQAITHETSLESRRLGYHHLGGGRNLHFKTFVPFKASWHIALTLHAFWNEVLMQVANTALMPDDQFQHEHIQFHVPLGDGEPGARIKLLFEIINLDGPVTREFVKYVAEMMMVYTSRGFSGFFQAWLKDEASSRGIWIILRSTGLQELQTTLTAALGNMT